MNSNGTILDFELAEAFKVKAYSEGLISGKTFFQSKLLRSGKRTFGLENSNSKLTFLAQESILSLLLFGKITLPINNRIRGTREFDQSIQVSPDNEYLCDYHYLDYKELIDLGIVQLSQSSNIWNKIDTSEGINRYLKLLKSFKSIIMDNISKTYKLKLKFIESTYDLYVSLFIEIQESRQEFFLDNLKDYDNSRIYSPSLHYHSLEPKYPKHIELFNIIGHHLNELRILIKSSVLKDSTIKTNYIIQPKHGAQRKIKNEENIYRLYQIILEEKCTFPYPTTISKCLELMNDKKIKNFREMLSGWTEKLSNNDLAGELSFRKEILKAKKDLKKVNSMKRTGKIVTFVSLPISIASAIMGMPLGLIIAPIGPYITYKSIKTEKEHNWLMFGTNY